MPHEIWRRLGDVLGLSQIGSRTQIVEQPVVVFHPRLHLSNGLDTTRFSECAEREKIIKREKRCIRTSSADIFTFPVRLSLARVGG